jgi:hypothetical protein
MVSLIQDKVVFSASLVVNTTPVDRIGARWLSRWRAPAPGSSRSVPPSPLPRRVGVHITAFGACTGFTRVTARRIARPPFVDFVARLRPARLPGPAARQLSNLTINYSSGSFPHWYSAPLGHTRKRLSHNGSENVGKPAFHVAEEEPAQHKGHRGEGRRNCHIPQ